MSVVLPLPKNPVMTVTGILAAIAPSGKIKNNGHYISIHRKQSETS
jgi:hypothetical protein